MYFVCLCVLCSAGAGRTGTFIALSNILERVKAEGLLDVFQTVKSLRMQRPHMVQTVVSANLHTLHIHYIFTYTKHQDRQKLIMFAT